MIQQTSALESVGPRRFRPDASGEELWHAIREHGAVLSEGAVSSQDAFEAMTETFAHDFRTHHNPTRREFNEEGTTLSVNMGPNPLALHAERATWPGRPELLFFYCMQPAIEGGETLLADGALLFSRLPDTLQAALLEATVRVHMATPRQQWEVAWRTTDRAIAAMKLEQRVMRSGEAGQVTHWFDAQDVLHVQYDSPCITRGWISGRPALANFLFVQGDDTPANVTSPLLLPTGWMRVARETAESCTTAICLRPGDVIMLDNSRWLHGRRAFVGERLILVRMGNVTPALRANLQEPVCESPQAV